MATGTIKRGSSLVTLYSGTFSDTVNISLSESAANFSALIIEFQNNDEFTGSVYITDPDGKTVPLTLANISGNNTQVYIKSKIYTINGNTLIRRVISGTYSGNGQGYFDASTQGVTAGGAYIGVTRVTGIR